MDNIKEDFKMEKKKEEESFCGKRGKSFKEFMIIIWKMEMEKFIIAIKWWFYKEHGKMINLYHNQHENTLTLSWYTFHT